MAAQATSTEFRSPKHKLISFFHWARDKWRARALDYRNALSGGEYHGQRSSEQPGFVEAEVYARAERRLELEAQLDQPPPRAARPSRLTAAAASRRTC